MSMEMRVREDLRPYQDWCAERIKVDPFLFLALFMGAGKSAIVLTAIRDLLDECAISRVLIIAPLLVAETTWPDEIDVWQHTRCLKYEVLTGSEERRASRARVDAEIYTINRENVPWLVEFWGEDWPYDMVIIDESTSFKNHKKRTEPSKKAILAASERARASLPEDVENNVLARAVQKECALLKRGPTRFGAMCKARKYIERLVLLTGTPAPNGLLDLWAQAYLLDLGKRLGPDFFGYRKRYFESDYQGYKYTAREGSLKLIMDALSDIMISLRQSDYITLPDVIFNTVHAPLPKKAMEEYNKFKRTKVSELYEVDASTQGVLVNKLLQFANSSMYQEDGGDIWIHDSKLEALSRIVEESAGEPLLVAYSYQFDLIQIKKKFPYAVVLSDEDSDVVRRWTNGEIQMLLAHPASAGHGLNLQYGGHIAVWYGFSFNLEYYLQFNKRLDRPGQKHKVIIHHIVAPDTADERVLEVLSEKEITQDEVLEAVLVDLRGLERAA